MGELLKVSGLDVQRGRKEVLKGFDLEILPGELVIISGENGSGKSTLIEAVAGIIPPQSGSIHVHGDLVADGHGRRSRPEHLFGLCLQADGFTGDEILSQRLQDVARLYGKTFETQDLLNEWNIGHRSNDLLTTLSKGQKRKVAFLSSIVPAIIQDKSTLILLDEPDAGLDAMSVEKLADTLANLRASNHGILMATHHPDLLKRADRIIDVDGGIQTQKVEGGVSIKSEASNSSYPFVGTRLDFRTMASLSQNGISGLLVMGALLALLQIESWPNSLLHAAVLAPSLACGLSGDAVYAKLRESRSNDWWYAMKALPPNGLFITILLGLIYSCLSSFIFVQEFSIVLILSGTLFCAVCAFSMLVLSMISRRLARPQALSLRLLTPFFILPWALMVGRLTT
ncbi:MAG TPA: ATP-binding cassette domain-containing protein [Candidatus Poseidoniales archaeon]|nr:MAG TPA: ATP-binding cassette domain-containing protein [Candidatus Poseidoniales archaeon]HII63508.1 ATP-binding cassette domain-containing protein [Candidatus Poseidoniaceae archaeon]